MATQISLTVNSNAEVHIQKEKNPGWRLGAGQYLLACLLALIHAVSADTLAMGLRSQSPSLSLPYRVPLSDISADTNACFTIEQRILAYGCRPCTLAAAILKR